MRSRADATPGFVRVADLPGPGARLVLDAEDSRYVARVCRAQPGEHLHLTDGVGGLATARVLEIGPRTSVLIEAVDRATRSREALLLCGAPEGERADWMVEKVAELGLAVLQPVDCERAAWERAERRFERWCRVAEAALRQSRARFLLELRRPLPLAEAIGALPDRSSRFLATPEGAVAAELEVPRSGVAVGLVGPAAGLSDRERGSLETAGFRPMALSGNRWRTETAAISWSAGWSSAVSEAAEQRKKRPPA